MATIAEILLMTANEIALGTTKNNAYTNPPVAVSANPPTHKDSWIANMHTSADCLPKT